MSELNKPINATPYAELTNASGGLWCDNDGLTKLEHTTIELVKSAISNNVENLRGDCHDGIVQQSILLAKNIFEKLELEKEE